MTSAKIKARLKALRKKFHLGEYRKSVSTHKTKKRIEAKTMARRKYFGRKHKRSGRSFGGVSPVNIAIGSAVYGAARPYVANMIPDIPQLGGFSDNVILGVGGYLLAKKGNGMMKTAGISILANEAFIAGSKAIGGMTSSSSSNGAANGAW